MEEITGYYHGAEQYRIAIVVAEWNEIVTQQLLEGAVQELKRYGVEEQNITVVYCPGSFEIPFLTRQCAHSGKFDAVISLGALIRGETPHFDYISSAVTSGFMNVVLDSPIPCIFGILTTDTIEQALDRAGLKAGNKGREYAKAALAMISVHRQLKRVE